MGPEDLYGNVHLQSIGEQDAYRDGQLHCLGQTGGKIFYDSSFRSYKFGFEYMFADSSAMW
jgi:hypothetical protein